MALLITHGTLGTREELVPRRVEGAAAFDADRVFLGGGNGLPGAEPCHSTLNGPRFDEILDLADGGVGVQCLRGGAQQMGGRHHARLFGGLGRFVEELPALQAEQLDIHAEWQLCQRVVAPGTPRVGPALDAEGPVSLRCHADMCLPDVESLGLDLGHVDPALGAVRCREDH